jgi:hypothetical protein
MVDSSGKEQLLVYQWIDGNKLRLKTKDILLPNTFYKLSLKGTLVKSPLESYPSKAKDTMFLFRFFTGDEREFGTISGEITDSTVKIDSSKKVTIQLLTSDDQPFRTVTLPLGKHAYIFEKVPRGKYRVRGWVSTNGDGKFDPGSVIPFRFGAPSGDYPDMIDVRPRWTVEKVNFEIR